MIGFVVKGVVFDLDATLVNLGEYDPWESAQREIIDFYRSCGCNEDDIKQCSSMGLFNLINEMEQKILINNDIQNLENIRDVVYRILDKYEIEGKEKCIFIPGSIEVLELIYDNKIKIGICTSNSSEITKMVIQRLGKIHFFSSIVGRSKDLRMKPYPDQVLKCFKEMMVDPKDGVMIGDSHNDVLAGKAAGSKTIAIPVYFTRKEALNAAKPDAVINSMVELPGVLLSIK